MGDRYDYTVVRNIIDLTLSGTQDYKIYARRTSNGPVPGVLYLQYRTSSQVPDSYANWFLLIVLELARRERRFLLAGTAFGVWYYIT